MGGEGSIAAMISSLKNNSRLLSKRPSYFDRDKKIPKSKGSCHHVDEASRFSVAERTLFIEKLKKERSRNDLKRIALLVGLVVFVVFIFWVAMY